MSIREQFDALSPGRKKVVVWSVIGAVFLVVTAVAYNTTRSGDPAAPAASREKGREITLEPDMIQKTMLREQRRELNVLREELDLLKAQSSKPEPETVDLPEIPTADQLDGSRFPANSWIPQPPGGSGRFPMPPDMETVPPPPAPGFAGPPAPPVESELIGGIGVLTNQAAATPAAESPDSKKKQPRQVYIPPSFMAARLLTGFDASTSGEGANNPEPLLLRIQTPALLPNDVKADLAGCFVIAEAVGRLNKDRADVRLVSLSCLGADGQAVIDTSIKGFVTDSDSKVGLSGRVVSRMGAATARMVIAGIFGGAGDAIRASAQTQAISPLGSTAIVNSDQLVKSAAGGGLGAAADTLEKLYLDLAKQATPVIEVGATKQVTVVITEGKMIEIREVNNDGAF